MSRSFIIETREEFAIFGVAFEVLGVFEIASRSHMVLDERKVNGFIGEAINQIAHNTA